MKTLQFTIHAIIAFALLSINICFGSSIEFSESPRGDGIKTTCKRDGITIYEHIQIKTYSLYNLFWNKKIAATILSTKNETTVQQSTDLPVSFAIYLDHAQQPFAVSVERPDGTVIDGLFRKKGILTPINAEEVKK